MSVHGRRHQSRCSSVIEPQSHPVSHHPSVTCAAALAHLLQLRSYCGSGIHDVACAVCRAHDQCNAWFWCKDSSKQSCFDQQSQTWVAWHGCKLLQLPVLPVQPVDPADMESTHDAARFRSFATGYVKREPCSHSLGFYDS